VRHNLMPLARTGQVSRSSDWGCRCVIRESRPLPRPGARAASDATSAGPLHRRVRDRGSTSCRMRCGADRRIFDAVGWTPSSASAIRWGAVIRAAWACPVGCCARSRRCAAVAAGPRHRHRLDQW